MTQLDFEVDFDYRPGMVGLRFFEMDEDGDRYPLRVQRLYNLLVQARRDPAVLEENVKDFLLKLAPEISKPAILSANLQILPITCDVWDRLKGHSAMKVADVRDHATGATMPASAAPIPLFFQLECHGDATLFSAVLDGPSGPVPWSAVSEAVRQRRVPGKEGDTIVEALVDGALRTLDLPVGIDLLNRLFRHDNQRITTQAIPASLPILIDGRLDRLRGPSVQNRRETVTPRLEISSDGGCLIIVASAKGVPIRFDDSRRTMGLVRQGDGFVVVEYRCRHYGPLKRFFGDLGATEADGKYKLQASSETVARVTALLAALPPEVHVVKTGAAAHLTDTPSKVTTMVRATDHGGWFDFGIECRVDEQVVSLEDLRRAAKDGSGVIRTRDGFWLALDADTLAGLEALSDTLDADGGGKEVYTECAAIMDRMKALPNVKFHATAAQLAERVRKESKDARCVIPPAWNDRLREYQREGVRFMCSRLVHGVGPLLADDMGLGKTLQVLTALSALRGHGNIRGPALVVCPASVVYVWERETATFFPDLRVALLTGSPEERRRVLERAEFDVVVCSYAVLRNDLERINDVAVAAVVLDEAQTIRNPDAQVTQAAWALNVPLRVAVTGTPLENRLTDLWSIMAFLNPGYLGPRSEFEALYGTGDARRLADKLRPLLMRRRKGEVAADLPPRTEEVIKIPFEPEQWEAYAQELARARQTGRNTMHLLAALTRLRQVCCHPKLVDEAAVAQAGKMLLLREIIEELVDEGHSVLVFSQFTSMLALIQDALDEWGVDNLILTGETSGNDRRRLVEAFNANDRPQVFLLSLKAAGTGLTLTKADYVVIFDPWWNPAAENQAIDRTHRIGQTRPVIAYRFVMAGSVEEKVLALQDEKRALFQSVVDGVVPADATLTADDLAQLLE